METVLHLIMTVSASNADATWKPIFKNERRVTSGYGYTVGMSPPLPLKDIYPGDRVIMVLGRPHKATSYLNRLLIKEN